MRLRTVVLVMVAVVVAASIAVAAPAGAQDQQPSVENAPDETLADAPDADQRAPGTISAFGAAVDMGPSPGGGVDEAVAIAPHPRATGYWITSTTGAVAGRGVPTHGDVADLTLAAPIVGIAPTASGGGYWLVSADGGVFTFGDAGFHGSIPGVLPPGATLAAPIVGMSATASGEGYWLAAGDGGVFDFGDARFAGSAGGDELPSPVVDIATSGVGDDEGEGYWLALRSGEVLAFGLTDHGSAAELPGVAVAPVVGIAGLADGYWLLYGDRRDLAVDDQGPAVEALQMRLRDLGYWVGFADGIYGTLTSHAVMAFEKVNGLEPDGMADPAMLDALETAGRPRPMSTDGDLVEVDAFTQVVHVVRGGQTVWVFNASTGTEDTYTYEGEEFLADTPRGRFQVERQIDDWRVSHLGRLYRPKYIVGGIAIHGSSYVPAYPASHGCIRLSIEATDFLWEQDLAPVGSDVWVYGDLWQG